MKKTFQHQLSNWFSFQHIIRVETLGEGSDEKVATKLLYAAMESL